MPGYLAAYDLLLQVGLASTALLLLAGLLLPLLRQPARKIQLIKLALLGLVALPLLVALPGYPRIALLSAPEREPDAALVLHQSPALRPPAEMASPAEPIAPPAVVLSASPTASVQTDFRFWLVTLYLAGAGSLLAWSCVGMLALARLVRSARPADEACRALLASLAGARANRVRLLISPRVTQPCAFGWLRPTIVLPRQLAANGGQPLRFALAHEWSHVARGDWSVWTLAGILRACYFPQPLVWLLRRQLRLQQDYLADAAGARVSTPEDYAEFLTSFLRLASRRTAPGLGMAGRRSDLHRRVVMLVRNQGSLEQVSPKRFTVPLIAIGLLAIAGVAALRAEPPAEPLPPPTTEQAQHSTDDPSPPATPPQNHHERNFVRYEPAKPFSPNEIAEKLIRLEFDRDPELHKLRERLTTLTRQQHKNGVARAMLEPLTLEILQVEEQIEERKTQIRGRLTNLVEQLRAEGSRMGETPPFSGKIRPGDVLNLEIVGGFPVSIPPTRTVEPDGNLVIGAVYGREASRINIGGLTLIEAGHKIEDALRKVVKEPLVIVTYIRHDDGVIAAGTPPAKNDP